MSVRDAIRESARCARNIELGGSVDFWIVRLSRRLAEIEDEKAVLTQRLYELRERKP